MPSVMLLAAGRGERLRPLTDRLPKALAEVAGEPLIVRHLRALAEAGICEVVVNLSHLGDQIRERLGDGGAFGLRIQYSPEPEPPLETGGGLLQALPMLGPDPFWAVNADICTDYAFAAPPLETGDLAHLVLADNPPHHPDGDFGLERGRVRDAQAARLTFAGIGLYRPELFAGCAPGRFSVVPLLRAAMARGQVRGEHFRGRWTDAGTPERLDAAQSLFRSRPRQTAPL